MEEELTEDLAVGAATFTDGRFAAAAAASIVAAVASALLAVAAASATAAAAAAATFEPALFFSLPPLNILRRVLIAFSNSAAKADLFTLDI